MRAVSAGSPPSGLSLEAHSPLTLDVRYQDRYSRLLVIARPLMVLPHLAALLLVYVGAWIAWGLSAIYVIRRGSYPRLLFDYMTGAGRWSARVLAYGLLLTDAYPRFALERQSPDDAVRLDVTYPPGGEVPRTQPLLAGAFVFPQLLLLAALYVCVALASLIAAAAILAAGRHPRPLFDFTLRVLRLHGRVNCYLYFMSPQYPGVRL